jgi:hypothetical protein
MMKSSWAISLVNMEQINAADDHPRRDNKGFFTSQFLQMMKFIQYL